LNKWLVLFLFTIILLVGCTSMDDEHFQSQPTQATSQPTKTPTQSPDRAPSSTDSDSIVYTNKQYGFQFSLPESWKGYSIVNEILGGPSKRQGRIYPLWYLRSISGNLFYEKNFLLVQQRSNRANWVKMINTFLQFLHVTISPTRLDTRKWIRFYKADRLNLLIHC